MHAKMPRFHDWVGLHIFILNKHHTRTVYIDGWLQPIKHVKHVRVLLHSYL